MNDNELLAVLDETVQAVRLALDGLEGWGLAQTRPGQYRSDLVADAAAVSVLSGAGLGVVSEESGIHHPERTLVAVVDPVDGSTNASRGLPWYATSLCVLDDRGPRAALVVNQASGERFTALRGGGATLNGEPIVPGGCETLGNAMVALAGWPPRHLGWAQMRSYGAAALDLCSIACGRLDAFIDCGTGGHAPWDYMGALLVCREAGAWIADAEGRDLVTRSVDERRILVAAATPALMDQALAARKSFEPHPYPPTGTVPADVTGA